MHSNFQLSASGEVKAILVDINNKKKTTTVSNSVLVLIKDVLARLMGNYVQGKIDSVKVYNLGLLLATATITIYEHPDTNKVTFTGIFDEASFSGTFDKLELVASAMGPIAEVASITWGTKSPTEQLFINWTITIL